MLVRALSPSIPCLARALSPGSLCSALVFLAHWFLPLVRGAALCEHVLTYCFRFITGNIKLAVASLVGVMTLRCIV